MSFSLTTPQVRDKTKDVTRRIGWKHLKDGEEVQPVVKCMGLKKGESIQKINSPVVVKSTRREQLRLMLDDMAYGFKECAREGFPHLTPFDFVEMFCKTHKGCTPDTLVTRIEFSYKEKA